MQKLHLVGFTKELDGLILSTRKGAKSGSFVVPVDANLLKVLGDTSRPPEPAARTNGLRHGGTPRLTRPESQLGPREMQELLRGGWTLEEVAVEAGVDVDWVSRFAAPVMAEMRLVLDQGRECVFDKPRVGPSALSLAASVRRNVAERGVRFTDEDFEAGWMAHQLDDVLWVVAFEYRSRGRRQVAEWTLDLDTGVLTSRGRLGTQLGHVQSTRRRVSTAPPPKPKPKAAETRAVTRPPVATPAPGRRVLPTPAPPRVTKALAPAPAQQPRARQTGSRSPSASTKKAPAGRTPKPPAATAALSFPSAQPSRDPWREELRRREAERAANVPPPAARAPEPAPEPEPEPEMRPVAIIGPTVRTLTRRPAPTQAPPGPPRREPTTGPVPVVRRDTEQWPDLEWSPGRERMGPLPPPGPLPVPDTIRAKVASPLGQVTELPELGVGPWFPPPRPTFRGARTATSAARPRRAEPLRGR